MKTKAEIIIDAIHGGKTVRMTNESGAKAFALSHTDEGGLVQIDTRKISRFGDVTTLGFPTDTKLISYVNRWDLKIVEIVNS